MIIWLTTGDYCLFNDFILTLCHMTSLHEKLLLYVIARMWMPLSNGQELLLHWMQLIFLVASVKISSFKESGSRLLIFCLQSNNLKNWNYSWRSLKPQHSCLKSIDNEQCRRSILFKFMLRFRRQRIYLQTAEELSSISKPATIVSTNRNHTLGFPSISLKQPYHVS